MIEIEEAIDILLKNVDGEKDVETVSLQKFLGRVLAEDIVAVCDNPPFNRSPLDGYAVRGEDVENATIDSPITLKVIGKIYAGQVFECKVNQGEALRLMTGAMIPEGANAVIRQEDTDYGVDFVRINKGVKPFANYCYAGEDYKKGEKLVERNTFINAGIAAIIASTGVSEVMVYSKSQVSVIATGDELIEPGEKMTVGKIYDSNLVYISSRLHELDVPVNYSEYFADDATKLADIIKKQAKMSKLIITTGGVSVGEKDIMHEVVSILNAKQLFWKVRIKPGTPTLAFLVDDTLVICLSGNPFGAIANFEILVRPVLAKLLGNTNINTKCLQATLIDDFDKPAGSRRFVRGYYENGKVSVVKKNHSSGAVSAMAFTNCLIEVKPDMGGLKAGDAVGVHLI